jgi:hypothetical protein
MIFKGMESTKGLSGKGCSAASYCQLRLLLNKSCSHQCLITRITHGEPVQYSSVPMPSSERGHLAEGLPTPSIEAGGTYSPFVVP